MLYGDGLAALAELCLLVYCLLDVLRTPARQVRNLPKPVWLLLCFVPPVAGPICWLLFGRPKYASALPAGDRRPGGGAASNPDDDEAFLLSLRKRADEQRRKAAEERRRAGGDPPA